MATEEGGIASRLKMFEPVAATGKVPPVLRRLQEQQENKADTSNTKPRADAAPTTKPHTVPAWKAGIQSGVKSSPSSDTDHNQNTTKPVRTTPAQSATRPPVKNKINIPGQFLKDGQADSQAPVVVNGAPAGGAAKPAAAAAAGGMTKPAVAAGGVNKPTVLAKTSASANATPAYRPKTPPKPPGKDSPRAASPLNKAKPDPAAGGAKSDQDSAVDGKSLLQGYRSNLRPANAKSPPPGTVGKKPVAVPGSSAPESSTASAATAHSSPSQNSSSPAPKDPRSDGSCGGGVEGGGGDVQLREKRGDQGKPRSSSLVKRNCDSKVFRQVKLGSASSAEMPPKPPVPENVDLSRVRKQYCDRIQEIKREQGEAEEEAEEEVYIDAVSCGVIPRQSVAGQNRVSMIPEFTEFEEYEDGYTPQQPSGGGIENVERTEDLDQVYEPLGDEFDEEDQKKEEEVKKAADEEEKKKAEVDERERKKQEEKERKEQEKRLKEEKKRKEKEEKERQKREKEEKKLFKLTGKEAKVGEGVIKTDAKGSKTDLAVTQGEMITIIRMEDNPPNKWLVRSNKSIGYVDINNIEIDTKIIRQLSLSSTGNEDSTMVSDDGDDDQPIYDDVPEGNEVDDMQDDEDIYEEC